MGHTVDINENVKKIVAEQNATNAQRLEDILNLKGQIHQNRDNLKAVEARRLAEQQILADKEAEELDHMVDQVAEHFKLVEAD